MSKKSINTFSALGEFKSEFAQDEDILFKVLSDPKSTAASKANKEKKLVDKVSSILEEFDDDKPYSNNACRDNCRYLAAYLLYFPWSDDRISQVFKALKFFLEQCAPECKKDLRAFKKSLDVPRSYIEYLGYVWDDLGGSFDPEILANLLCESVVSIQPEPEVKQAEEEMPETPTSVTPAEPVVIIKEVVAEDDPDRNFFGVEDQHTEFKSSFVESYNEKRQVMNICRAICAFLNADGGFLFIGVDDTGHAIPTRLNGYAHGLEQDLDYMYRAHRLPNMKKDMDAFARAVKKEIMDVLGRYNTDTSFSNNIIVTECECDPGYAVLSVEVKKSSYMLVNLEGVFYQRSGAETRQMTDEQVDQAYQNMMSVSKVADLRRQFEKAIREKKQVTIFGYTSVNSLNRADRHVEPVHFTGHGEYVACFDLDKMEMRQFKLLRIGSIRARNSWEFEEYHQQIKTDAFGWASSGKSYSLNLMLGMKAATYLMEIYRTSFTPDRLVKVKDKDDTYFFNEEVFSLEGATKFFLANADDISILDSKDASVFKAYVRKYIDEKILPTLS